MSQPISDPVLGDPDAMKVPTRAVRGFAGLLPDASLPALGRGSEDRLHRCLRFRRPFENEYPSAVDWGTDLLADYRSVS